MTSTTIEGGYYTVLTDTKIQEKKKNCGKINIYSSSLRGKKINLDEIMIHIIILEDEVACLKMGRSLVHIQQDSVIQHRKYVRDNISNFFSKTTN